jgi:asparagine synthase (glutamine-hydrolysing)
MIGGLWDPDRSPDEERLRRLGGSMQREGALAAAAGGRASAAVTPAGWCLLAGEVYDDRTLRERLGLAPEARSAEVLALGLARLGVDCFEQVEGAFAAVASAAGKGVLACDPQGIGALFVHAEGRDLTFASELHGLLTLLRRTPDVDGGALTGWLEVGTLPPSRTLLAGVRRLEPGELLLMGRDSLQSGRQARPARSRDLAVRVANPEAAVREGVEAAVRRRCRDATGVLLSGGLDSSVVASIAARAPDVEVRPRALYSVQFPGLELQDETPWIDLVTRELGLPSVRAVVEGGSIVAGMLDWAATCGLPLPAPAWFYQRPLMARLRADGVEAVLDGEGGDELFAAQRYLAADRLRAGRPLAAVQTVRRVPGAREAPARLVARVVGDYAVRGALPLGLHRRLVDLRGRSSPSFNQRWAWQRRPGPRWAAHLTHVLTAGIAAVGAHDYFRLRAAAAGLAARQPLRDLDLAELVLALPPELAFDPVHDRALLRRSLAGVVPEAVLWRRGKARFEPLLVRILSGEDRPALRALLATPQTLVTTYLPSSWPRDLATPPSGPGLADWADRIFRAAAAECWLRALADREAPEELAAHLSLAPPRMRFLDA